MKSLAERMGIEYNVSADKDGIANVIMRSSDTESIWAYQKPVDTATLNGLFKEVYSEAIDELIKHNNPFWLDNTRK